MKTTVEGLQGGRIIVKSDYNRSYNSSCANNFGGRYDAELGGWVFSSDERDQKQAILWAEKLLGLPKPTAPKVTPVSVVTSEAQDFRIKLDYADHDLRDKAKSLGAKWNPDKKIWTVTCSVEQLGELEAKVIGGIKKTVAPVQPVPVSICQKIQEMADQNQIVKIRASGHYPYICVLGDYSASVETQLVQIAKCAQVSWVTTNDDDYPTGIFNVADALPAYQAQISCVAIENEEAQKSGFANTREKSDFEYKSWETMHNL